MISGATAEKIGIELAGQLVGLAHDLGKYTQEFLDYISSAAGMLDPDCDENWVDARSLKGKIDHSSAGAQWIWQALSLNTPPKNSRDKAKLLAAQILALVVASHHGGLIDCIAADLDRAGQDIFSARMNKDLARTHLLEVRKNVDDDISQELQALLTADDLISSIQSLYERIQLGEQQCHGTDTIIQFKLGLVARMLLSCLVEGDHRNSSEFENPVATMIQSSEKPDWQALAQLLECRLATFSCKKAINQIRADVSAHCLSAAQRPLGMYTLTVPTGGGKTLASLRFALNHALRHGLDRIVYVIPYTSIIDQNALAVREILEPEGTAPGSVLLEHHSNLLAEDMTWQHKLITDNWDAPIIYTTSVQLLEALFGAGTRNARRMHALARSVLIFDEVQTLPLKCAHLFANAMNFLVEQAGSSVLLCSATQPLLQDIDPTKGAIRLSPNAELMPNIGRLFSDLKRTDIIDLRRSGGWSNEEVAQLVLQAQGAHHSTLAIVNTKRAAREIFEHCSQQLNVPVYHLSTSMCPAHRRTVLQELRDKLEHQQPLICISTQLIEAGVDISFGSVVRSLAGMDSIAQAAGRCNRNQEQPTAPVFVINLTQEKIQRLTEIIEGQKACARVLDQFAQTPEGFQHDLLAEPAMTMYFRYYFFHRKGCMDYPIRMDTLSASEKDSDVSLLSMLGANKDAVAEYQRTRRQSPHFPLRQAFRTAALAFKAIDSATKGIVVPYGAAGREIAFALNGDLHPQQLSDLLRQVQQFSVNLFEYNFKALCNAKALYQTPAGIWCLDRNYYHDSFGVSDTPQPSHGNHNFFDSVPS
jgi:CRISPR-associated endonuclease/helicase Cas3